ncbi:ribose-phosphate diphosphokinase [Candidatus Bathyarchaeota archaeon]|nr:ribose-phosphate diphosphokinase [Candidatus Bathyarchaeota archaeon]MBS7613628.1 ribose-phosphate diphosphokinase [Candidatus Bathyarchaeota archaeon]MBS7617106.1 ribose-phosphate diphosphokinase [Candidatus Bathyarchaeota archaeon]
MRVLSGPSSVKLAENISLELKTPLIKAQFKRFPDGEFYFRLLEDVKNEDILVVQSLPPPQDQHILELIYIVETCRELEARKITVYTPYLAYSRQDRRYLSGEAVSSRILAETLQRAGVSELYTVDIHNLGVLSYYRIPAYNLTAADEIMRYFLSKGVEKPLVVAPDDEEAALKRAEVAAKAVGTDYDWFEKKRDRYTGEIVTAEKTLNVSGRDAVIIDDIISTGGTAANAARILKKQGARRVYVGVTHALLAENALERLREAGIEEVVGTDSIPGPVSNITTAPIIARKLKPI